MVKVVVGMKVGRRWVDCGGKRLASTWMECDWARGERASSLIHMACFVRPRMNCGEAALAVPGLAPRISPVDPLLGSDGGFEQCSLYITAPSIIPQFSTVTLFFNLLSRPVTPHSRNRTAPVKRASLITPSDPADVSRPEQRKETQSVRTVTYQHLCPPCFPSRSTPLHSTHTTPAQPPQSIHSTPAPF